MNSNNRLSKLPFSLPITAMVVVVLVTVLSMTFADEEEHDKLTSLKKRLQEELQGEYSVDNLRPKVQHTMFAALLCADDEFKSLICCDACSEEDFFQSSQLLVCRR